jgi:hypothetical protein
MMESRKEVIRKYKEIKPEQGTFAIRCRPTGQVWVGAARNLYAARNGSWFALRAGGYHQKSLQAEWNVHGEAAFEFSVLEKLDEDVSAMAVVDLLKEKKAHWTAELGAQVIV